MDNAISWFEIPATDIDRAQQFYETVFQIKMQPMDFQQTKMRMFPIDDPMKAIGFNDDGCLLCWANVWSRCYGAQDFDELRATKRVLYRNTWSQREIGREDILRICQRIR